MSFSSPQSTNTGSATGDKFSKEPQHGPNFGQRLEQYFAQKNPIMGGLMQEVFGRPQQTQEVAHANPQYGEPQQMPAPSDMLAFNTQPKQGGGGAALLKLIMGA